MTACDWVIHIDVPEEPASSSFGMVQMRLLFV